MAFRFHIPRLRRYSIRELGVYDDFACLARNSLPVCEPKTFFSGLEWCSSCSPGAGAKNSHGRILLRIAIQTRDQDFQADSSGAGGIDNPSDARACVLEALESCPSHEYDACFLTAVLWSVDLAYLSEYGEIERAVQYVARKPESPVARKRDRRRRSIPESSRESADIKSFDLYAI